MMDNKAPCTSFEASRAQVEHQTDWEARALSSALVQPFPCVDQTIRYHSQHRENYLKVKCTVTFHLKRQARGWRITGSGRRVARGGTSSFTVVEGILSDCGRAYWVEQYKVFSNGMWKDGEDRGKVLVRGSFESVDSFRGIRLCRMGAGGDYLEGRYDWFKRDRVLASSVAKEVPRILQEQLSKRSHTEACGVVFEQRNNGPVVIASLAPNTLFGESRLAVGMPVVLVNQRRVESAQHAAEILRQAQKMITIVTFRDTHVFNAALAERLVSTIIYKSEGASKTGIIFRKRGDALFISSIKEGSIAEEAGLQEFSRVWAINNQSYFETSQAAADYVLTARGYIHLVTDPTGSVDQPTEYQDDDTAATAVLVDAFPMDAAAVNGDLGADDDQTIIPLVSALPVEADYTDTRTGTNLNVFSPSLSGPPSSGFSHPCMGPEPGGNNGGGCL